jgi:hypothetical protein
MPGTGFIGTRDPYHPNRDQRDQKNWQSRLCRTGVIKARWIEFLVLLLAGTEDVQGSLLTLLNEAN